MNSKSTLNKVFLYFIIFLLIFFNNETLPNNLSRLPVQPVLLVFLLYLLTYLYNLVVKKRDRIILKSLMLLFTFAIIVIISFLNDGIGLQTTNAYYLIMLTVFIGFLVTNVIDFHVFSKTFTNIILSISIYSILVTYVFKEIIRNIPNIFPVVTNSAGTQFINTFFSFIHNIDGISRNYSIFREPGVYAFFLIFALIFSLYTINYKNVNYQKFVVLLLSLSVITTFSSPGYLALFIVLLSKILEVLKRRKYKIKVNNRFFLTLFTFIFIFVLTILNFSDNIIDAFNKFNFESSSFQYRYFTLVRNISFWLDRPFIGYGIISGNNVMYEYDSNLFFNLRNYHNTSTFTSYLVFFGIIGFSLFTFPLFKFFWITTNRKILILLSIILLMNSQLILFNPIIFVLIFYSTTKSFQTRNIEFSKILQLVT